MSHRGFGKGAAAVGLLKGKASVKLRKDFERSSVPLLCSHFKLMAQILELTQNSSLYDKPILFSLEM